jgi:indole-3-glycerol phosphate synthase
MHRYTGIHSEVWREVHNRQGLQKVLDYTKGIHWMNNREVEVLHGDRSRVSDMAPLMSGKGPAGFARGVVR